MPTVDATFSNLDNIINSYTCKRCNKITMDIRVLDGHFTMESECKCPPMPVYKPISVVPSYDAMGIESDVLRPLTIMKVGEHIVEFWKDNEYTVWQTGTPLYNLEATEKLNRVDLTEIIAHFAKPNLEHLFFCTASSKVCAQYNYVDMLLKKRMPKNDDLSFIPSPSAQPPAQAPIQADNPIMI